MGIVIPFPRPTDAFLDDMQAGACDVTVSKHSDAHYTTLTLRGHPALVQAAVEAQMELFNPFGYGTHVTHQRKCAKGELEVTVIRLNEPLRHAC